MTVLQAMTALSIFFFITGYLGIWAIREGGSFAFMAPSRWKWRSNPLTARKADRTRPPGPSQTP